MVSLQAIQDRFSKITGFGAVISDPEGNPITDYSSFSPICDAIRKHPMGKAKCKECDDYLGHKTVQEGEVSMHYCHAGLVDIAAPIVVDGNYMGVALCGQVLCDSFSPKEARKRFDKSVEELGLDKEYMDELFENIPVVTYDRLMDVAHFLQVIASYIAEMGMNQMNQLLINRINLNIVEEQKQKAALEHNLQLAELRSLETTVNPHFLFNALNTVARLALLEDAPKTEEMAYTLAEFLRHNLRRVGTCVPFREEIECCNKYLQIQSIRFNDRFKVEQQVSEEALNIQVPAMTLQPLVENAMIHGIKDYKENGEILIKAGVKDDVFIMQISDNGEGITHERMVDIKKMLDNKGYDDSLNRCIGLSNVCKQFNFFFDSQCAMDISSEPGEGTKVTITAHTPSIVFGRSSQDA